MAVVKFGLKILGTHAVMSIVQIALMPALFGIWQDKELYQWLIGLIYIGVFWIIIYADISYASQNDVKRGRYHPSKGFISGLIASIPGIILYLLAMAFASQKVNYFEVALRVWLVPYIKIFTSFDDFMPAVAIVPILLFPILCGLSYLDGPRRRKKVLDVIEKTEAMKAEKSKVKK